MLGILLDVRREIAHLKSVDMKKILRICEVSYIM